MTGTDMRAPSVVRVALTGVVTAAITLTCFAGAEAKPGGNGRYIVVLKDSVADARRVANEHARGFGVGVRHIYQHALKGYSAVIPNDRVAALRRDSRVDFISEDRPVQAVAQALPTGVNRIEGDKSSQVAGNGSGSTSVRVAVIDSGSGPHTDLNIAGGKNCSTGSSYSDGNGHGTHVAGTVGARDNGAGVVGVAPGAPIYSVRVLNNYGSGSWSTVICGVDWVTNTSLHPRIPVANMSLGGSGWDDGNCGNSNNDALHRAICRSVAAGTTYVVAAGNQGSDLAGSVPASYDEVLAATAIADFNGRPGGGAAATCRSDVDETPADFSNYASAGGPDESHTIAAPGVCIRSTYKSGTYKTISGTSMASPHVAGTLALCLHSGACAPGSAPSALISKIRSDSAAYSENSYAAHAANPAVPYFGFQGDPKSPIAGSNGVTLYYGYLASADNY
ncbi:MAG TPA: S8 family serine peptidase [Actinomycetota bacterium]|nr:S8 family serine peptidase [Actinomycetota bacterium]